MVIEDPERGTFVSGLSEYEISSVAELNRFLRIGNNNRTMAPTTFNQFSSRSHAMISFQLYKTKKSDESSVETRETIVTKLYMVDLAGSERAAVSENKGQRMIEGANINKSLLALGNCINMLSSNTKQKGNHFVPYRDSKLTRLLKDSLGGNTKTLIIACISPSPLCYEDTKNTLKFGQRARKIKHTLTVQKQECARDVYEYKLIIQQLSGQIQSLKQQLEKKDQVIANFSRQSMISFSPEAEHDEIYQKQQAQVEELSKKLFDNLEEQWEIKQSLSDIESINRYNEDQLSSTSEEAARRELQKTISQNRGIQ